MLAKMGAFKNRSFALLRMTTLVFCEESVERKKFAVKNQESCFHGRISLPLEYGQIVSPNSADQPGCHEPFSLGHLGVLARAPTM